MNTLLPKVRLWLGRGVKDIKRERETGGRAGLFLALRSFLNFSFHSSSSFCASFHSTSDKALHSQPHSSTLPSSLHFPHTHPGPVPSLLALLSSLRGPALAAIHQPDGPPLTGPPLSILPPNIPPSTKHPYTHICTQQPGHSPPYALYQAAAMLIGRKGWMEGWGGGTEKPSYSKGTEGGRAGRVTLLLHLHSHARAAADLLLHKGGPPALLLPPPSTPLFPSFSFKSILYPSGKGSCKCSM